MSRVLVLLRVALGLVFVVASWSKVFHPAEFAEMVMGYRMTPAELVTLVATFLPWLELLLGLGLIFGLLFRASAAWAGLLSFGFLAAKISVVLRGLDISCGCFSLSGGSSITWSDLPANVLLLLAALLVLVRGPGPWTLDQILIDDSPQAASAGD